MALRYCSNCHIDLNHALRKKESLTFLKNGFNVKLGKR